jgi:hypothetical protein
MKLLKPAPVSLLLSAISSTESLSESVSAQAAEPMLPHAKLEGPAMAKKGEQKQKRRKQRAGWT